MKMNTIISNTEYLPNAESEYFINTNKENRFEMNINGVKYCYSGKPFNNHYSQLVSVVISEEEQMAELVLEGGGILMVTKVNGDELIQRVREYRTPMYSGHPKRNYPVEYKKQVEDLMAAYQIIFGQ